MPSRAKAYIALVIASGALLLLLAAESWYSAYPKQFFIYLGLAAFTSALKVRIPGLESNISPNFVFLLLGIVALPFSQVVAMSLVAALVQSLWAAKRPRLVQVAFNVAALVLTSGLAYKVCHITASVSGTESPVVCLILAGSFYFPLNSLFVSTVIGLVEGQPVRDVCARCYEWVFPYFMLGIAFAGLMTGVYTPPAVWKGALVLLPTMVFTYFYFQNRSSRALPAMKLPTSLEEAEEPVEVG